MSVDGHPVARDGDATGPGDLIDSADVPGVSGSAEQADAQPSPEPVAVDDDAAAAPRSPDVDTAAERRALLELLIYAWDRARSPGVWERLTVGLQAIGVTVERPDGEPFDPARHEVGGVVHTQDDTLVDTVAETEVVGFTDRGTVLREPIVVVHRRG